MKILLLGGNGFIGTHLINKLLGKGFSLKVFSHSKNIFIGERRGVKYIYGDFLDLEMLRLALEDIDLVIHLISTTNPANSNKNITKDIQDNIISSVNLFELMVEKNIKKLIFFSTGGAIYGNTNAEKILEHHPKKPISSYGVTKLTIEKYIQLYEYHHGFEAIILRPSNPYGPLQNYNKGLGVITKFLYLSNIKKPLTVIGCGNNVRDFIYIQDLVNLCLKAVTHFTPGIYHVSSGVGYSINNLISIIRKRTTSEVEIQYFKERKTDVNSVILDNSRTSKIFDWFPEYNIQEGIKLTDSWIKKQVTLKRHSIF